MKTQRYLKASLMGVFLVLLSHVSLAHQISTAYLTLEKVNSGSIHGQIQLRMTDLNQDLNLNQNNDNHITWGEIKSHQTDINSWLKSKLKFSSDNKTCALSENTTLMVDNHFNDSFLVINWQYLCQSTVALSLTYEGLFDIKANHKLIVNGVTQSGTISRVLDSENNILSFDLDEAGVWQTFIDYTKQGVIHILIGLDHIMFLLILLLSTLLISQTKNKTRPTKDILIEVLKLVTAFTLAHSVTLVLTALGWLQFSSRWVEVIIAFTVAFTALNNIKPLTHKVLPLTFIFGLFHGMGFAGVLGELGLPNGAQLIPILSFNLGVEFGQMLLIALILPVLILIDRKIKYSDTLFKIISLLVVCLSVVWIFQRI